MAKAIVRNTITSGVRTVGRPFSSVEMDRVCAGALEPIKTQTAANARTLRDTTHNPSGGHLDQGVAIAKIKGTGQQRTFWVAFKRRARKIAHLVEFGTAPHWQPHYRGGFMHPGARAKPFFRPAFESEKGAALTVFASLAWAVIAQRLSTVRKG